MSKASDYLETAILNVLRNTTLTGVATCYVGLFDGDPTDDGSGATEVTTTIRVAGRVACTFGAPSGGSMSNSADVDFGTAAGSATVAGFGIYDASSGGNLLVHGTVTSQAVGSGDTLKFGTGNLVVSVA